MDIFMGFGAGMIVVMVLSIIFGGFMMWIAAKIARVEKSSFGRAIIAALGSTIVSGLASLILGFVPVIGNGAGFLIGILVSILVIKGIFETSTGKALLVWAFNIIAVFIAILLGAIIAASGFMFL